MLRAKHIARSRAWIIVRVNPEIGPGFRPDVIRFGRMHALTDVVILRGVGNLDRVRVAGRHQAIEVRRGGIAKDLLRTVTRAWLRPVVVFQRDHEDGLDLLQSLVGKRVSGSEGREADVANGEQGRRQRDARNNRPRRHAENGKPNVILKSPIQLRTVLNLRTVLSDLPLHVQPKKRGAWGIRSISLCRHKRRSS